MLLHSIDADDRYFDFTNFVSLYLRCNAIEVCNHLLKRQALPRRRMRPAALAVIGDHKHTVSARGRAQVIFRKLVSKRMFKLLRAPLLSTVLRLDSYFGQGSDGRYENVRHVSLCDLRFARCLVVATFRPMIQFGSEPLLYSRFVAGGFQYGAGARIGVVEIPTGLVNDWTSL